MFESVKDLIDSRLGRNMVLDDFMREDCFFIKIPASQLYSVAFFLKNDPDVRLTLLDQIIILPLFALPWPRSPHKPAIEFEILYQLKSLKLPYRVTLVVDLDKDISLMSVAALYAGAKWQERDIGMTYGFSFEEGDKR